MHLYLQKIFGIMVDGTQYISGKEQESIVIKFICDHLQPIELFCGSYEIKYTTGRSIADIICDVLIKFVNVMIISIQQV